MKKKNKFLKKVKLHCEKKAKEAHKLAYTKPNKKESEAFQEEQVAAMEARLTRAIELFEQNRAVKKENSRRAFYKEFMKLVEASNVIIQVLDARDPLGSRCVDVVWFTKQGF